MMRSPRRRSHLSQMSESHFVQAIRRCCRAPVIIVTDVFGSDIAVLKTYGAAPYANALKKLEKDIKDKQNSVNEKIGVKVITLPATSTPLVPRTHPRTRNPTQVLHLHTFGMSPPTGNEWRKSSPCK
jgi:hypothetical protein